MRKEAFESVGLLPLAEGGGNGTPPGFWVRKDDLPSGAAVRKDDFESVGGAVKKDAFESVGFWPLAEGGGSGRPLLPGGFVKNDAFASGGPLFAVADAVKKEAFAGG